MKKRYSKTPYRNTAYHARKVAKIKAAFFFMKAAAVAAAAAQSSALRYSSWVPVGVKAAAMAASLVSLSSALREIDAKQDAAISAM